LLLDRAKLFIIISAPLLSLSHGVNIAHLIEIVMQLFALSGTLESNHRVTGVAFESITADNETHNKPCSKIKTNIICYIYIAALHIVI